MFLNPLKNEFLVEDASIEDAAVFDFGR